MQVVEAAVKQVGKIDQAAIAETMHKGTFDTVVGKVSFGKNGEWSQHRVMYVQYGGITGNSVDEWRKPGKMTVLSPKDFVTGKLKTPWQEAKK
jgi:branched-chain amino acid transport system substrate-binding protein